MNIQFNLLPIVTIAVVAACWFAFAAILYKRKRVARTEDAKRDRASDYGLLVQGLGCLVVWCFPRQPFTSIAPENRNLTWFFSLLAVVLAMSSVAIIISAIKTLGREWSVKARLIEGHKLVVKGPYNWVRHPIYTGLLGMLIATGLAMSQWPALLIAITVYLIGTIVRIKSEERLLRSAFGSEFDNYSRRVSAIVPRIL